MSDVSSESCFTVGRLVPARGSLVSWDEWNGLEIRFLVAAGGGGWLGRSLDGGRLQRYWDRALDEGGVDEWVHCSRCKNCCLFKAWMGLTVSGVVEDSGVSFR